MKSIPVLQAFSIEKELILQNYCFLEGTFQMKSCPFVPQVTVVLHLLNPAKQRSLAPYIVPACSSPHQNQHRQK